MRSSESMDMEKNDRDIHSVVKTSSESSNFHCRSSDLEEEFTIDTKGKYNLHLERDITMKCDNNAGGKSTDNNINFNFNGGNNDDIGCVHYKRRAKFVVSIFLTSFVLSLIEGYLTQK